MKKDLKSVVLQVAKFLNKTIPDKEMDKLLNHLSFKSMQKNPSVNLNIDAKNDSRFIRKGIVGEHKSVMTPDVIAQFDEWIAKNNVMGIHF